jgi:thioredoxin-like negative regulator of GroEL
VTPERGGEASRPSPAQDWHGALRSIDAALSTRPRDAKLLLQRAQCLLALGRPADACEAAAEAQACAPPEAVLFDAIGAAFSRSNDQERALTAFDRAVSLASGSAHFLFNRATVLRFLGRLDEAEADYDRVIALKPADYEAYVNRTELRTQTAQANHVGELEALIARGIPEWQGQVQIRYALAKEYEDIGDYGNSFRHLQQGASERRRHMRYDVAADVATVDWIMEAFPTGSSVSAPNVPTPGGSALPKDAPIFIVGLPRSGSTLVDRILGSHSAIHSAGELPHFALCIVDAVRRSSGARALPRRELVARSARLDFDALGLDYLARVRHAAPSDRRFTDKMPLNYLYCGLIRQALPNAKIVHVTRRPMAACYAMYKTLFADGYPFSYDLTEIGRYYIAYRRLMDHWHATLPGAMYTQSYESLVADQTGQTRGLLDFCGLEWQDACAEFHRNSSAVTTASAAQIRRPVYDSSVSQWRHYAGELEPLLELLRAAGIDTD